MAFFDDYLLYCSENEAPQLYHLWSGLSVLSASISRRVWLQQGVFTFYPNLYVILVGSAGSGKSTAQNIASSFLLSIAGIPMSADSETVQSFLRFMSSDESGCKKTYKRPDGTLYEYSNCAIFVEEWGHFIAHDPSGWVLMLVDAYSKECLLVRTKNKGNDLLPGPYISILACMTPETTNSMLKQNIISTGFGRRTIFVWAAGRDKDIPRPTMTPEMTAARRRAITWCQGLQRLYGEIHLSQETIEWWDDWYINKYKTALKTHTDSTTISYFETKSVQLQKVAMLIALSESYNLEIKVEHYQRALVLLEETERYLPRVFEGVGRNVAASTAARIMALVEAVKGGPILRSQIEKDVWGNATGGLEEVNEVIDAMVKFGKLVIAKQQLEGREIQYLATPEGFKKLQERNRQGQQSE